MNNEDKIKKLYAELKTKVFEALGTASMCWIKEDSLENTFDSTTATNIGNDLINDIDLIITQMNQIYSNTIFSIKLSALELIQEEHRVWCKRNFGDTPANQPIMGVAEEIGELAMFEDNTQALSYFLGKLAHGQLKTDQSIRVNENHLANIKDAVADIMIYLISYCNVKGIDAEENLKTVWNQVKQRDWTKNKINGAINQQVIEAQDLGTGEKILVDVSTSQLDLFTDEKTLSLE